MNRIVRRYRSELERQRLVRLIRFLEALVERAIWWYSSESVGDGSVIVELNAMIASWVRWCADDGAFIAFGIRDRGDLVELPPMAALAFTPGLVLDDVLPAAEMIAAGGTRRGWVRPGDLALAVAAR